MILSCFSTRVGFYETDELGFVYHARYLEWLDATRVRLLDNIGFPYTMLQKLGYNLPLIEAHLAFKNPAKFDDIVTIEACIENYPKVRLTLQYKLKKEDTLIAKATTVHFFMNTEGKVARAPQAFQEKLLPYWNTKGLS